MSDAIIGLVLDRSGSMRSMWEEAVAGYNEFKNDQAKEDGTAWIILNYFDNQQGQKYYAWDARDIPDLSTNDKEIYPRSMTALVDATIRTIKDTERWLSENDWFNGKVFVVVITDGMENASEANPATLKELTEAKENAGWEFIYLAANVDTRATANLYGFSPHRSMTYDSGSVGAAYSTLSANIARSRATGDSTTFTDEDRDVRNR